MNAKNFLFFLFFFATALLPASARPGRLDGQNRIHTKILANGFTVYVMENHDQPQVFGGVVIRAGSKHDPADATGMAHYLEHMLFKGTQDMGTTNFEQEKIWLDSITHYYDLLGQTQDEKKRLDIQLHINKLSVKAGEYAIANEMDRMLAEMGGTGVNASTTVESTNYYNSFPANQLEKWMSVYAHRFQQPVFRLFQSELETVYEEKNRGMDDMGTSIFEYYLKHFFKKHPYGQQTTIGETEHLKNPSLKKMYEYFDTYYVPNNMALVLCGDVNPQEVFKLAEKNFGSMPYKAVPEFKVPQEDAFKGKEVVRIRRTPIKAGVVGFRLPPNNNPDMTALDVISDLLSNSSSSGSIDQLINNNKILLGGLEYMPYNDGGAAFLYFVPKIVGQSMGKAERLVMNCLNDIKAGNFSDDAFAAVKTNRIKQSELSLESNYAGANGLMNAFIKGVSPETYFGEVEKVKVLTKEDIVRTAQKYFGENSLAMYSRMGFVKKDKLAKPPFKPVVAKNETHSEYYHEWKKIPGEKIKPKFVDLEKEIDSLGLGENTWILRNQNPLNKIATMQMVFGTGSHYIPLLAYVDNYLLNCGTGNYEINTFNQKLYALGCQLSMDAGTWQFTVRLTFPEENLEQVLVLVKDLLTNPVMDKKYIKKVLREKTIDRQMNKRSADYYADALNAYVLYGEKSAYLDKMGVKKFKHTKLADLSTTIDQLWQSSLKICYTGTYDTPKLATVLKEKGFVIVRKKAQPVYSPEKIERDHNQVFLVNMRKARQSQVSLMKVSNVYNRNDVPKIAAFNKYFGGDMSSLMFQEIREFRSLAYATSASYSVPLLNAQKCMFIANAGTQNDKTNDCIDAMYNLVNEMPLHPERMESIKSALVQSAASARPSFRSLIYAVENWKRRGYTSDPSKYNLEQFNKIGFSDIEDFYNTSVKGKPTMVCVSGRLKAFDTKALKKYGTVKKIKKKKLVKK